MAYVMAHYMSLTCVNTIFNIDVDKCCDTWSTTVQKCRKLVEKVGPLANAWHISQPITCTVQPWCFWFLMRLLSWIFMHVCWFPSQKIEIKVPSGHFQPPQWHLNIELRWICSGFEAATLDEFLGSCASHEFRGTNIGCEGCLFLWNLRHHSKHEDWFTC